MSNKYLVQSNSKVISVTLLSEREIISRISMSDCSDEEMSIYDVSKYGKVVPLVIYGTWHDMKKPLYIKVTDEKGRLMFDGYGEDH